MPALLADAFEQATEFEVIDVDKPVRAFRGDEVPWVIGAILYDVVAARNWGGSNVGDYDLCDTFELASSAQLDRTSGIGQIVPSAFRPW
jgi:hypothetical protein